MRPNTGSDAALSDITKARAYIDKRGYVSPDDIQALAGPVGRVVFAVGVGPLAQGGVADEELAQARGGRRTTGGEEDHQRDDMFSSTLLLRIQGEEIQGKRCIYLCAARTLKIGRAHV